MKVLLDECVNQRFRTSIDGHDVFTTAYMRWDSLKNGRLLWAAGNAGFAVVVTRDRGIEHQQNLATLPLSVIVLHCTNDLPSLVDLLPGLLHALESLPLTPVLVHVRP